MKLTPQQQACLGMGHRRVVAGAGTGKTAVLVEQILYWLEQGAPANRIMAVTFTHRAGMELTQRLERAGIHGVVTGTIHSWAYRALVAAGQRLTLVLENDILDIMQMQAEKIGLALTRWTETQWENLVETITEGRKLKWAEKDTLAKAVLSLTRGYMKVNGLIYVDEVIPRVRALIEAGNVQGLPLALAVDEYQDSTLEEHLLYQAMKAQATFFVGDPRQSLYSWRGGDWRLLIRQPHDGIFNVQECWRCPSEVVALANRIQPDQTPLRAAMLREGPKAINQVVTEYGDDPFAPYSSILEDRADKTQPLVVLCRRNATAKAIAAEARRSGFQSVSLVKGSDEYSKGEWRLVSYKVRHAVNPANEWVRWRIGDWVPPDDAETVAALCPEVASDAHSHLSLPDWLTWYARRDVAERLSEIDADLVAMTVHASKGLEFDDVAVDGVSAQSLASEGERCGLYVAVTRTKKQLWLVGQPEEILS